MASAMTIIGKRDRKAVIVINGCRGLHRDG
jgi:hypothetical protein